MAFLLNRRLQRAGGPGRRVYRERINPLTLYSDVQFKKTYRLSKESILYLAQRMKAQGFKGPLHGRPNQRTLSAVLTVSIMYKIICKFKFSVYFISIICQQVIIQCFCTPITYGDVMKL